MALVVLSVVERRLDAVRAVLDGADVVDVAAQVGVHRATLHRWVARRWGELAASRLVTACRFLVLACGCDVPCWLVAAAVPCTWTR